MGPSRIPPALENRRPADGGAPPEANERTLELERALDAELGGSLNVRRTALRILGLLHEQFADWAVISLDEPGSRGIQLFGGTDPDFHALVTPGPSVPLQASRRATGLTDIPPDLLAALLPHDGLLAEARALPAGPAAIPLRAREGTIGAILTGSRDGAAATAEDLALAERLARRAALALEAALIYERHRRATRVLELSLRPPHLPASRSLDLAAGFRPALDRFDFGGDFYDVHGRDGDRLLVIGDVCGKGVEAAVLNGRARQTIRTAAHFDLQPARVLDVLNDVLCQEESDQFVTVACCRLREGPSGTTADIAVAGHPPPLVVRRDGAVESPAVRGRLSGVIAGGQPYEEVRVDLAPGDALVLYTDGVHEARGPSGFYGTDRLRALASAYAGAGARALSEAVERAVVEHLSGQSHDDITVMVAAVPGEGGST